MKLKGEIRAYVEHDVHMTLEDFGTNALNCDSVAKLSVSGLELILQKSCHDRRQEVRGRTSCRIKTA